uniref:Sporozoite surface protein 2 n=2 Tax=Cajanus cajan TaxID=3821 RepID=A0A151RJK5_CAJCA|nr:Sporozoite surface protein 2 [Cajanus cajan]
MEDYKWELGLYFVSREKFKEAITTYAVHSGRNLKYKKNDKRRIKVICKQGCPWVAYCAKVPYEESWQLRKIVDIHTCSREHKMTLLSTKWLSDKLKTTMKENPKLKLNDIRERVQRKWNASISKAMACRARKVSKSYVEGSFKEQFKRIYDYSHELIRSNPGSTVKVKVDGNEDCENNVEGPSRVLPTFQRMYICFQGCKESFLKCRPIIGLDGCFLKGYYGGQILAAVGRDPNEQMLPICFAVVEGETKESWEWFLRLLISDLGGFSACVNYTFISDQQKGLLPAINELLPGVDQRFCVRHLYNNFRKKFPGKKLKDLMWKAATATYPVAWEREMHEIKKVDVEAFKHLIQIPPRYWSKSRFKPNPKCDVLVNNMSEAFNSVIVDAREKPIVTMLEDMRLYLMNRWAKNRKNITLHQGDILPKILKKIEKESNLSKWWIPSWAGEQVFEVKNVNLIGDKYTINLQVQECSCRKWMLTGLPCCHAISCMRYMNLDPKVFVPEYYKRATYEVVYQSMIYPVNGQQLWTKTWCPNVLPPPCKKMPGRPKKRRNLEPWELKKDDTELTRRGCRRKCSRCKSFGHNKSTCKENPIHTHHPTQPSEPTQVSHPTQPSEPTHVSEPTQVSHPTHTNEPTQVSQPTQPSQPIEVSQPTQPSQPTQVSQPTQASEAAQPREKLKPRKARPHWKP